MKRRISKFLWLEGVFDEATVRSYFQISAAANLWQQGFIKELLNLGHEVEILGYAAEKAWPLGRLFVRSKETVFFLAQDQKAIDYINLPSLRYKILYFKMLSRVQAIIKSRTEFPDYLVVYSCLENPSQTTPAIEVARKIKREYGIRWVCLVVDGAVPVGADGYVFVPWSQYECYKDSLNSIYLEGGVPELTRVETTSDLVSPNTILYMGMLTEHGGAVELAEAFSRVKNVGAELWICGRGTNNHLAQLAESDKRIKLKGFVSEKELNALANRVALFANPRPVNFSPNQFNFPSKLLHYLAYGKPVLSTITEGMSPDYRDVIIPVDERDSETFASSIEDAFAMASHDYEKTALAAVEFSKNKTWNIQVGKFLDWLETL